jgi:IS5 family transposase
LFDDHLITPALWAPMRDLQGKPRYFSSYTTSWDTAHRKTRYRGLAKNTAQLLTLFGLANLVLARRRLLAPDTQGAS